jgi:hypothetical protein
MTKQSDKLDNWTLIQRKKPQNKELEPKNGLEAADRRILFHKEETSQSAIKAVRKLRLLRNDHNSATKRPTRLRSLSFGSPQPGHLNKANPNFNSQILTTQRSQTSNYYPLSLSSSQISLFLRARANRLNARPI